MESVGKGFFLILESIPQSSTTSVVYQGVCYCWAHSVFFLLDYCVCMYSTKLYVLTLNSNRLVPHVESTRGFVSFFVHEWIMPQRTAGQETNCLITFQSSWIIIPKNGGTLYKKGCMFYKNHPVWMWIHQIKATQSVQLYSLYFNLISIVTFQIQCAGEQSWND